MRTVEGEILHERAHNDRFSEKRGDLLVVRGLAIHSAALGVRRGSVVPSQRDVASYTGRI